MSRSPFFASMLPDETDLLGNEVGEELGNPGIV